MPLSILSRSCISLYRSCALTAFVLFIFYPISSLMAPIVASNLLLSTLSASDFLGHTMAPLFLDVSPPPLAV